MKRIKKAFKEVAQIKLLVTVILIISLAAGIIAASYFLQRPISSIKSARVEDKVQQDSLKRPLPCNRYYNEVLMY